jgi:plasmid stabilization system protein ParE
MKTYDVRFLHESLFDLEEIVLYISQDSHEAALRMHDKLIEKANDLTIFPKRGRLVPDKKMAAAGYRMFSFSPYILFYRVAGRNVFICRVLHGATNYPLLYEKMTQKSQDEHSK